ncbi:LysR family transcriptional regulator [Acerihabitans sp. KWT182]|uniref:LysR family transcriptional regulator n=1 Tax=Acerihabitans sp. KWT182 TaxID=3157919 RepID=A0AAU7Q965_9GAMM
MTTIMEKTTGLVAFVRTVQNGSFAGASRVIGASPSAVSKSVARLEERLGVRLLQRSTRTIRLTLEGADYFERVAPLLQALEEAENQLQTTEMPQGLIRVSVPVLVGRVLMAQWAAKFILRYPRVKFDLDVTDRNVDIIREGFDLALRIGTLPDSGLNARMLGNTSHILAASPTYLSRRGMPLSVGDLQHHDCLRFLIAGRPFPYAFADGGSIVPEGPIDTSDGATLRQAAIEGAGIIQIPRFAIAEDIAAGTLIQILPTFPMLISPIHVLHPFGRQLPVRARLFMEFLAEQFQEKNLVEMTAPPR